MNAVICKIESGLLQHCEHLSEVELLRQTYDIDVLIEIEILVSVNGSSEIS